MGSPATKLFSGSHHQSLQDVHFRIAGNDIHSPTYNILFNAPESLVTEQQTGPSVRDHTWNRIAQQIWTFFRSPENRGALTHGGVTACEDTDSARMQPSSSLGNTPRQLAVEDQVGPSPSSQGDKTGQSEGSPGRSMDDYLLSLMGEPESERTPHFRGTTSAEIYTRSMLSVTTAGLACWHPKPRKPAGERGIVPGDVGTFDLAQGFRKIFNLWEDESLPDVARYQLPPKECTVDRDEFAEGHTIVSGTSSKTVRSQDGKFITGFEFCCQSERGAVLACTTSADLEQLLSPELLRDFLIEHAGIIYQHADSVRRIADADPLYIVSGCIKSETWALAAYSNPPAAPYDLLTLSRRASDDNPPNQGPVYDWIDRGTSEARFGSNSAARDLGAHKGKDQCLFLQGFKLALSQKLRARLRGVRLQTGDGQHCGPKDATQGRSTNESKQGMAGHGLSEVRQPQPGLGTSDFSGIRSSPRDADVLSSDNFQVEGLLDSLRTPAFHPCDKINEFLLEMTGADCALSHDDDWRKHSHKLPQRKDDARFDIIASQAIQVRNGVVFLLPRDEFRLQEMKQNLHNEGLAEDSDYIRTDPITLQRPSSPTHNSLLDRSEFRGIPTMDLGKKHHARAHTDSRKKDANTGRQALSLKPTIKPQLSTTSPKLINAAPLPKFLGAKKPDSRDPVPTRDAYRSNENDDTPNVQRVVHWLSTTDAKRTHADTLAKRTPGTGTWFIEDHQFTLWSRGERDVLWVTGMPGSGKTVLASIATDHIKQRICAPSKGEHVVLFFQCQYKVSTSPRDILATFLRQLFEENNARVSAVIDPLYVECQTQSTPLSEEKIVDILATVLDFFQKVYIVVDALDELKESPRNKLLRLLTSLPKGNLFLTSRPMNPKSNVLSISDREVAYLQIAEKNKGDIATFVSTALKTSHRLTEIMASTGSANKKFLTRMNQKSSGIFLLASLQVESLKQCISRRDLLDTMEQLPSGVTEMYAHTMERIGAQGTAEASLARRALLWVTYAQTDLTLKRLQRALAISPDNGFRDDDIPSAQRILSCCLGLLVVDPSTRFARLVHFTADEFIRGLSDNIFKSPHTFISLHCISYLSPPSYPSDPASSQWFTLEPLPISTGDADIDWKCEDGREIAFPYAYSNWGIHIKQAWSEPYSPIPRLATGFIMSCTDYICNISSASGWQTALCPTTEIIQPIHLVALHDLSTILPSMKETWRDRTSSGSTALHLAVYNGHEAIVQAIFKEDPSWVNDMDEYGYTPFMLACQQGHDDIVTTFLSAPSIIDFNAQTRLHSSTALILATTWGRKTIVDSLVHRRTEDGQRLDVNLHAQNNQGQTALMIAAALGFQEIAKILLQRYDLDVNQGEEFGHTAFTEAAIHGSISIFKLLLRHPRQAFNPSKDTALIRASTFGREAMVKYLLSLEDIDPNVRSGAGNTALITVAAEGNVAICNLLLQHPRIDVNAQNRTGATALMMANKGGHTSVVDLLKTSM